MASYSTTKSYSLTKAERGLMLVCEMGESIDMEMKKMNRRISRRLENWTTCKAYNSGTGGISILLFGVGGVGKSALGNVLLGDDHGFSCGNQARGETSNVSRKHGLYEGHKLTVYDTPGYLMRSLLAGELDPLKTLKIGIKLLETEGVDVFVLVFNAGNMRNLNNEIEFIKKANLLNYKTFKHCILVVTHSGTKYATKSVQDFIDHAKESTEFAKLIENIQHRVVLVELGSAGPLTEEELESNPYYHGEKEACRDMVMNMVRKVIKSNVGSMYSKAEIEKDLACFPPLAEVFTPLGKKMMEELELNDEVLVVNSHGQLLYEKVIMFSHANPSHRSYFCTLSTEDGKVLQLSPGHLLHVGHIGNLIAAQDVNVGDVVFTSESVEGVNVKPVQVTATSGQWLTGIYCPHTPCGSIIVDGVAASCYTNHLSPTLAHAAMLPVRVAHRLLPDDWFRWMLPYNQEQGMPSQVLKVSRMMRWS